MIGQVPWAVLSYAAVRGGSLASTLVLAHLLEPHDFGIFALAALVIALTGVLRDPGISAAFIVRRDLDDQAQQTVLGLMIVLAVGTGALIAILAEPIAAAFDDPDLAAVLRALSLTVVVGGGASWFYETLLRRELEFRKRFAADVVQTVSGALCAIPLAIAGAGVWSLVVGQIIGFVAFTAVLLAVAPMRLRPRLDRSTAGSVLLTGRSFAVQSAVLAAEENVDYVVVGRVLGTAPLGFYSMAYRLGELPYHAVADPINKVTFAGMARMGSAGASITGPFLAALRLTLFVTLPIGAALSALAAPITEVFLGDKWLALIGPLSVLGILAGARTAQGTLGWLLNAVGGAHLVWRIPGLLLLPTVPTLWLAADRGGMTTVAWVMVGYASASTVALALASARFAGVPAREQLTSAWPSVVAAVGAWCVARSIAVLGADLPPTAPLAAGTIAVAATYIGLVWLVDRDLLYDARSALRRSLGRGPAPRVSPDDR